MPLSAASLPEPRFYVPHDPDENTHTEFSPGFLPVAIARRVTLAHTPPLRTRCEPFVWYFSRSLPLIA